MRPVISLLQIIVGVLLIIVIIIQQKGTGLGSTFGGDLGLYRTKRGAEKLLFYTTFVLSTIFIILSIVGLAL